MNSARRLAEQREQRVIRDDGGDIMRTNVYRQIEMIQKNIKLHNLYISEAAMWLCGSGNGSHTINNCTPKDNNIRSKKDDVLRFERY